MLFRIITLCGFAVLFISCKDEFAPYEVLEGEVFGTYYRLQFQGEVPVQESLDSLFEAVNASVNSYVDGSEITTFNKTGQLRNPSPTFVEFLEMAQTYNKETNGYFEPTLYGLSQAWGFGFGNREVMDSVKVDSLRAFVGLAENILVSDSLIQGRKSGVTLDLSALGEGYTLEKIAGILERKGITNFLAEIGGEVRASGVNSKGEAWRIGIEDPAPDSNAQRAYSDIVSLTDEALSTSGNYRKFYVDDNGTKRPHIIDPFTGYPVSHNLLSVSIRASNAMTADAIATACMAMGTEKAKKFIGEREDLEGLLIFDENGNLTTWHSPNFFKDQP